LKGRSAKARLSRLPAPKVFVSYFARFRRSQAVGPPPRYGSSWCRHRRNLDQWDLSWAKTSSRSGLMASRSQTRRNGLQRDVRSEGQNGTGGVGYELIVIQAIDSEKFIPVPRGNAGASKIPNFQSASPIGGSRNG
jgi:hypothetical protein